MVELTSNAVSSHFWDDIPLSRGEYFINEISPGLNSKNSKEVFAWIFVSPVIL